MKRVFLLSAALTAALMASCSHPESSKVTNDTTDETNFLAWVDTPQITTPPAELKLDPFYTKYMNVNGIHVVSSWRVPDSCFYAAYVSLDALTKMMPAEVMVSLICRNTRIIIETDPG